MAPGSPLLRDLADVSFPAGVRLTSIYSQRDSVCPPSSCRLEVCQAPHLKNVEVTRGGHLALLTSGTIPSIICHELESTETPVPARPRFTRPRALCLPATMNSRPRPSRAYGRNHPTPANEASRPNGMKSSSSAAGARRVFNPLTEDASRRGHGEDAHSRGIFAHLGPAEISALAPTGRHPILPPAGAECPQLLHGRHDPCNPSPQMQLQFHLLSFEGPDGYSRAGGIASRVEGLARTLATLGFETHLWFIGDPSLPGHESSGWLHLHRWCQWISRYHPGGVYDGEEAKRNDLVSSLPPYLLQVLEGRLAGRHAVILAEEWQTADAVLHLDWLLRRGGLRERVSMLWNANNVFGFERIDWPRLGEASVITTVRCAEDARGGVERRRNAPAGGGPGLRQSRNPRGDSERTRPRRSRTADEHRGVGARLRTVASDRARWRLCRPRDGTGLSSLR